MLGQFGQISFVVWRESVEALLIIGILNAWLTQQGGDVAKRGQFFLGMGAIAGCLVAIFFAYIILTFSQALSEETFEYFQIGMVFIAAILILQMVVWLRPVSYTHLDVYKRQILGSLAKEIDKGVLMNNIPR